MGNCISRLELFSLDRDPEIHPGRDDESDYLYVWEDESDGKPPLSFVGRLDDPKKNFDHEKSLQNLSTNPEGMSYRLSYELNNLSLDLSCYSERTLTDMPDQKAGEFIDYSSEILSSSGWRKHEKNAIMTGSMYDETCPVVHIHLNVFQSLSLDKIQDIILDPSKRAKWDRNRCNIRILESISATEFIYKYTYKFPVRNREFVEKVSVLKSPEDLKIVSYSVNYPNHDINQLEAESKSISGRNLFTYFHVSQRKQHIEIEIVFQVDLVISHNKMTESMYATSVKQWAERLLASLDGL